MMIVPNISTEDLKKLPLRAIVALATRCARRVESLSLLPDGHPDRDRCRTAIDGAIRLAEDFARGSPCRDVPTVIRDVEACRAIAQGEYVRETAVGAVVWTSHAAAAAMEGLGLGDEPAEVSLMGTRQPNPFPQLANVAADLAAGRLPRGRGCGRRGPLRRRVHQGSHVRLSVAPETRAGPLSRGRPGDRPLARGAARQAVGCDPSIRDLHDPPRGWQRPAIS